MGRTRRSRLRTARCWTNYSFEADDQAIPGWSFALQDGAKGGFAIDHSRGRSGLKSLRLTKSNGVGALVLRTAEPVMVAPGSEVLTFRVHFQAEGASPSSLLLLRFEDENGNLIWDDTGLHGGAGWQSQSILRNTPGQFWDRRMIMVRRGDQPRKFFLNILVLGNPVTVWLDDIEFPAPPWSAAASGPTWPQPAVTLAEALKTIAARPALDAKVETVNDHAVLKVNGQPASPVLYMSTNGYFGDFKQMAADGGINFQTVVVSYSNLASKHNPANGSYPFGRPLWTDSGKHDFAPAFRLLENAIRHCPAANLVLGVYVEFPADYIDKNPDQAWVNAKGEKLYGTAMHVAGFADKLPEGMRWWPSPYSRKAQEATGNLLREFVSELKAKPYGKIVAGTFISGGHDGQFFLPERDFSVHCRAAWQEYLRGRYRTDEALAAAWNQPGMTFVQAEIPPKKPGPAAAGGNEMFFSPASFRPFADFNEFEGRMVWLQPEYYAGIVKEEIGRDIFALTYCMGGGLRSNFTTFLESKVLDGFIAQPFYEYRYPGYSGGLNAAYETFSRHGKLVVKELDTRNWMRGITDELDTMRIATPLSLDHFKATIFKEIGQMLAHYQGYWWYDIGANAYRHPDAMRVIRQAKVVTDEVFPRLPQDSFAPEVAFVHSLKSPFWGIPRMWYGADHFPTWCIDWMNLDLATTGVPIAHYFLEDIVSNPGRVAKAKVLVFVNTYYLTAAETAFINQTFKRDGKFLVWHYAPGYVTERDIDLKALASLVGMNVETDSETMRMRPIAVPGVDPLAAGLKPLQGAGDSVRCFFDSSESGDPMKLFCQRFRINDPAAVTLAKYHEDGQSAIAVKRFGNYTSVYVAAVGGLSPELLNNIAREAGAFVASKPGPVINLNGNFISIHGVAGGKHTINLPHTADVYDPFTGQVVAKQADKFELDIMPQKSYWFVLR